MADRSFTPRSSLTLWRSRLAYRRRRLALARKDGHADDLVTKPEAQRIHKWERLVDEAVATVAKREAQLAGGHVASPLRRIVGHSWGWHPGVHDGVDLICEADATIFALCDGTIVDARPSGWWGKGAKPSSGHPISDGDGIIQLRCSVNRGPFRPGLVFAYGHAEKATVKVGDTVRAGQMIGHAGFANAWHVHFMVNDGRKRRADGGFSGVGDRDPWPYVDYAIAHSS